MKTDGTYEIRAALSERDSPTTRALRYFECESCGYERRMMIGETPHRTVTIELSVEGYLLSKEYLHPEGLGERPADKALRTPDRARCPVCLLDSVRICGYADVC